ncbi:MAG: hypothetical protein V3R64_08580 [Sphingomonadales bacterium]
MTNLTKNGETPEPIIITNIAVLDSLSGKVFLTAENGTLVFPDLPVLTIPEGIPQNGGPIGGSPYTISFNEGNFQMHLPNLVFPPNPSPPPPPPYIFTWLKPLSGGISVTDVSAFDTTQDTYVLLDQSGEDEPTAKFYQPDGSGGNYFMVVKANSKSVQNGGPVSLNNNSIHYTQTGFELTLAEVLYQGQTPAGEFIFQQIDAENP